MTDTTQAVPGAGRPRKSTAHRVIFVDLARAIAVLFMIQGHTWDALLDPAYRHGVLFNLWIFQRGLTSCMFLLLSGFAFSIATSRRWSTHLHLSGAFRGRVRRFAFFILLGHGLHFPVARLADLRHASDERWRSLMAVDVLQLIGMTLILVQLLVLASRTQRRFMIAAFAVSGLIAVSTPMAWTTPWTQWIPMPVAAYLSPSTGSQFPLIPWAAYVFLGAGLGQVYGHWGAGHLSSFANRFLLGAGAAMVGAANLFSRMPFAPFGPSDFWSTSPNQFLIRAGSVLVGLGVLAHVSRRIPHLPHIFVAIAQESLVVYFVHLCIVYGSIWNTGLRDILGTALPPERVLLVIVALATSMAVLAWAWNWCKHVHGHVARYARLATAVFLIWALV